MVTSAPFRAPTSIPGLVFRNLRAPDDYPAMNAAANAARIADGSEWISSDEQFRAYYEHLSNCDPARDVLIAEVAGRIVGYGRAAWYDEVGGELDGHRIYQPITLTDPSASVPGLMAAIHDAMEARLLEIAAEHRPSPKSFESEAPDIASARIALLRARGYEPVRHSFSMVRPGLDDLPDAPLPDGLEIREVEPGHMRAIWEADQEAFRDHWGFGQGTEEDYQHFLHDPLQDPTLWRVAWDGDQVAGQVRSFINAAENAHWGRKRGYVENISVRRPWRRRGLARALIADSFPLLRARGMTEGALGVDTQNPTGALGVYERCGFQVVKSETIYRRRFG